MDIADEIAHCAMMIDQARDLMDRGDEDRARERLNTAREHAERARSATDETDDGHARQVQECLDASEALLKKLEE